MARQQDTKLTAATESQAREQAVAAEAAAADAADAPEATSRDAGDVDVTFHGQRGYPASYEFTALIVGDRELPWKRAVTMSAADADALKEAIAGQGYRVSYSTDTGAEGEDE